MRTAVSRLVATVRLIHIYPSITVVLTSGVMLAVAHHGVPPINVLLRGMGMVACSQVAIGSLNDYVDRFDDARTQPSKPLATRLVRPATALGLSWSGAVACCVLAVSFGIESLAVAALGLASGAAYDLWLKRTPLSFLSYVVSFLSLITWVWLVAGVLSPALFVLYPFGAGLLVAAHVANALPDVETDRSLGQHGLVVVIGPVAARWMLIGLTGSAALGAGAMGILLRSESGILLALAAGIGVATATVTFRTRGSREMDVVRFRVIAPTIALIAISALSSVYAYV